MVKKQLWFERKFQFDLDVRTFPGLVERLRGTPARVDELTSRFQADILNVRMNDAWSIQENVGHLLDLEPLWLGRVEDILAGLQEMRPADLTNRKTHEANHNESPFQDLITAFRNGRMELVTRLEECNESQVLSSANHPRLQKPMRILDLAFFIAEHDDHHLATINQIGSQIQAGK